jgi:sigma-B regulation protein RsbU (phosphoserine phosphatase)
MQRKILCSGLRKYGLDVVEASTASEALELCRQQPFDVVISDWMMEGMTGLEFCQAFKTMPWENYGYFIFLTGKTEKDEMAAGLQGGADDFLIKPVSAYDLQARIMAGERIISMHRNMLQEQKIATNALEELRHIHDGLQRDLNEARKLQAALVPKSTQFFGPAQVSLMLEPSGHVGGDLVGCYAIDADRFGVYAIDVSGHGVSSALMTFRLAGSLSSGTPEHNIALYRDANGKVQHRDPAEVIAQLNRTVLGELETEHYFTAVLAEVNTKTGDMRLCQAGHPHPMVQRANGTIEILGAGGMPVGLLPMAVYSSFTEKLGPGDKFLLASDGITEATNRSGKMFDTAGLATCLRGNGALSGHMQLQDILRQVRSHTGANGLDDDVSIVLVELGDHQMEL